MEQFFSYIENELTNCGTRKTKQHKVDRAMTLLRYINNNKYVGRYHIHYAFTVYTESMINNTLLWLRYHDAIRKRYDSGMGCDYFTINRYHKKYPNLIESDKQQLDHESADLGKGE